MEETSECGRVKEKHKAGFLVLWTLSQREAEVNELLQVWRVPMLGYDFPCVSGCRGK